MRVESRTTITPAPRVNSFPATSRGVEIRPIVVAPKINSEIRSSINPSLAINKPKPAISPEGRMKRFAPKDWQVVARPRPQIARLDFRSSFREKNHAYAQRVREGQFRRPRVSFNEIQARFPRSNIPQEVRLPEQKFVITRPQIVFDRTRPVSPIRKPEQRRQVINRLENRTRFDKIELKKAALPQPMIEATSNKQHIRRIELPQARVQVQKEMGLRTEKKVQRLEQMLQRREAKVANRSSEVREIRKQQIQIDRQKVQGVRAEIRKIQTQEQAMQCLPVQADTRQSRQEVRAAYLRLRKEMKCKMVCLAMQKPKDQQAMPGMPKIPDPKWVRDEVTNAARDRFIHKVYARLSRGGKKTVSGYELAENIPQYMKLKSKLKIMLFGDDHGLEVIKNKLRNMGKIYNKDHMGRTSKPLVEDHTAIAFRYQGTPVSENWVDTVLSGAAAQPVRMPAIN